MLLAATVLLCSISKDKCDGQMFFISLQILLFLVLCCSLLALVKNKLIAWIGATLGAAFLTLQIVSLYMTQDLADYRLFAHFDLDSVLQGYGQYVAEMIALPFLLFISVCILRKIAGLIRCKKVIVIALIIMSFSGLIFKNGMLYQVYEFTQITQKHGTNFNQELSALGIPPSSYISPEKVQAKPGKNIIVIVLESVEKNFLLPEFDHLLPYVEKLNHEYTSFTDLRCERGSNWTAGSLYTMMTGFPAFFNESGNHALQGVIRSEITGLPTVLDKAGYSCTFLGPKPEFGGIKSIMDMYGVKVLSEKNVDVGQPASEWGLHDVDIFNAAKKEVVKQKGSFALIFSTISTHPPFGVFDERVENKFPPKENRLLYMASALDNHLKDFINFLSNNKLLENTAVYIVTDHLLMSSSNDVMNTLKSSPRKLLFLSNIEKEAFSNKTTDALYQINLPRLILDGAGVKTNAKFYSEYINNADYKSIIDKHKLDFVALNDAALRRNSALGKIALQKMSDHLVLSIGAKKIPLQIPPQGSGIAVNISNYGNIKEARGATSQLYDELFQYVPMFYLTFSKEKVHLRFGKKQATVVDKNIVAFDEKLVLTMLGNYKPKTIDQHPRKMIAPNHIFVRSSGYSIVDKKPSCFATNKANQNLLRGLTVLFKAKDGTVDRASFDTFSTQEDANNFLKCLVKNLKSMTLVAIAATDDAARSLGPEVRGKLARLGFLRLAKLRFREAYLGFYKNGQLQEAISPLSIENEIDITKCFGTASPTVTQERATDRNRFIAHAGGAIDGHRYTNSLEAMNNSYNNGFRMFELDIIRTSDNHYVAAHDWKSWARQTGYTETLPPSRNVFLQQLILNKYKPMDMTLINTWFAKHSDAVLVTDKINSPQQFSAQFTDKKRLMMELFTPKAVQEGLKAGMRSALVSESVIPHLAPNYKENMMRLGITDLAVSRRTYAANREFFASLAASGIHTYVFHVNADGLNEKFVLQNDIPNIYGMYADNWQFNEQN